MILIENDKINEIKKKHHDAIFPYSLTMLEFYLAFFNSVGNGIFEKPNSGGRLDVLEARFHSTLIAASEIFFDLKNGQLKVTKNILKEVITTGSSSSIDLILTNVEAIRLFNLFKKVKGDLYNILMGSPEKLQEIVDSGILKFPAGSIESSCIKEVFNYGKYGNKGFALAKNRWTTYTLTSELNLFVCPYCNRNWIVTVTNNDVKGTKKKIVNPQIDHFFSQEEQPQFSVSFYNLIPSCEACNSRIKKRIQFNYKEYLHPYKNCYGNYAKFETIAKDLDSQQGLANNFNVGLIYDQKINASLKSRIEKSHKTFQIETIYEQHGDIISDLYYKKLLYSYEYVQTLQNGLPNHKFEIDEIYRITFGNYYFDKDFNKRPFSKLTRDVVENLGIFNIS